MSEDRGPILAIAAMFLIIVLSIIAAVCTTRENRQALETYETAESLLAAGDYEGALELLTSIQGKRLIIPRSDNRISETYNRNQRMQAFHSIHSIAI